MARQSIRPWICVVALVAGAGSLTGAPFAVPNEGPVAFRRDLLPLDVDTMMRVADELTLLAQAQPQDSPESRRKAAQALALALALNPAGREARDLLVTFSAGQLSTPPDRRRIEQIRRSLRKTSEWLESSGAGTDGRALGECLADVVLSEDSGQDLARWAGWIPEVTAYFDEKPADKQDLAKESPMPQKTPPVKPMVPIALESASILTPLWTFDPANKQSGFQSVAVLMKASVRADASDQGPLPFSIEHTPDSNTVSRLSRTLGEILAKRFKSLPTDCVVTFELGQEQRPYLPERNRSAISGAAAVLLAAAVTGQEPTGTVIGEIDEEGLFKAGPDFWDQLRSISKGSGGRLVIPANAAEFLPSVLAMEDPEFFLKYDVLLTSNLSELLELTAKNPSDALAGALGKFQDIRAKSTSPSAAQYVANRFVRQRLAELGGEAAYFASPRFLAIQGAGERPTQIPKRVLAYELRRCIQPVRWVVGVTPDEMNLGNLDKSTEVCRAELEQLDRYVESKDREFFLRVRDMTNTLRAFSRASRMSTNRDDAYETIEAARAAMRKSVLGIVAELAKATGEPGPEEAPASR
jgi:hypothetical protein